MKDEISVDMKINYNEKKKNTYTEDHADFELPRGGTKKAFKSLDESPGSNELGFLVRDLWYS